MVRDTQSTCRRWLGDSRRRVAVCQQLDPLSEVQALLNLWAALKQHDAVEEAIDYVAAEYTRRTNPTSKKSIA
jgi:hypothetical protein